MPGPERREVELGRRTIAPDLERVLWLETVGGRVYRYVVRSHDARRGIRPAVSVLAPEIELPEDTSGDPLRRAADALDLPGLYMAEELAVTAATAERRRREARG